MGRDFYPYRESEIGPWATNLAARLLADPARYGVSEETAQAYALKCDAFIAAYQLAKKPGTRTAVTVEAKNIARKSLEAAARAVVRQIRARKPQVTATMRIELGLCPDDPGGHRAKLPRPASAPVIEVRQVLGRRVSIQLCESAGEASYVRKPRGVYAATIFTCVGEHPPADIQQWRRRGFTTRARNTLVFDDASLVPGTKIWITAYWQSPTAQPGPLSAPVYTHLQYGMEAFSGTYSLAVA
jgi:hypothetical protein